MQCIEAVRRQGFTVQLHASALGAVGSMKSQLKRADASGADFALIFGQDEMQRGEVTVKSLRDGVGSQTAYPVADVASWIPFLSVNRT
jgi:histidyl-tRNA synthetase